MNDAQPATLTRPAGREALVRTDLPGLRKYAEGKVRDIYDLDFQLLLVATDRISAYDVILSPGIPDKGRVLNQLSAYWFKQLRNLCPSHYISTEIDQIMAGVALFNPRLSPRQLEGRAMLVNKCDPLPLEFVVRGYLDGSAWREYRERGQVCGLQLPEGLKQGDRLPEPLFTPARKAKEGHDENITLAEALQTGHGGHVRRAMQYSLALYEAASRAALERGIIIADTKFEFGLFQGDVVLIDELFTPDSSRFWDVDAWKPGGPQQSFDKQFVRDYLDSTGWNHEPPPPTLPDEIVAATRQRYLEIFRRLTGYDPD